MRFKSVQDIWNRLQKTWQSAGMRGVASIAWSFIWMQFAGLGYLGRVATWIATWFAPPFYERRRLALFHRYGYIAPNATIYHKHLQLGTNIFIGDRVTIFQARDGGTVDLGDRVRLYDSTYIQTGQGGSLKIGADTTIQPRCQFSAYKAAIQIGSNVQIAPNCAFYPYDHGIAPGEPILKQPLQTKGGIFIEDDVWLGYGVIVLDGVRIGKGAVIGAGAVVTHDIPDEAIAIGVPARVVKLRSSLAESKVNSTEAIPVAVTSP